MGKLSQENAPIYEALENLRKMRVVPFDVPGHKRGRGNPELTKLLGEQCMNMDAKFHGSLWTISAIPYP